MLAGPTVHHANINTNIKVKSSFSSENKIKFNLDPRT